MGPGPTNSYVDSRAKCETKRNRRQLAMLLKYWTMFIQQSAQVSIVLVDLGLSHI